MGWAEPPARSDESIRHTRRIYLSHRSALVQSRVGAGAAAMRTAPGAPGRTPCSRLQRGEKEAPVLADGSTFLQPGKTSNSKPSWKTSPAASQPRRDGQESSRGTRSQRVLRMRSLQEGMLWPPQETHPSALASPLGSELPRVRLGSLLLPFQSSTSVLSPAGRGWGVAVL